MGKKTIKVIFDTNVYVSFYLTHSNTFRAIFDQWKSNAFTVYISEDIISEIHRGFRYPRIQQRITDIDRWALAELLEEHTSRVHVVEHVQFLPDLDDANYLSAAQACSADFLVTGDKKHLLSLKKFGKTRIVSPKKFVEVLQ